MILVWLLFEFQIQHLGLFTCPFIHIIWITRVHSKGVVNYQKSIALLHMNCCFKYIIILYGNKVGKIIVRNIIFGKWKWKWSRVVSDSLQPVGCSPPSSSVHGILLSRILEWIAISFSNYIWKWTWNLRIKFKQNELSLWTFFSTIYFNHKFIPKREKNGYFQLFIILILEQIPCKDNSALSQLDIKILPCDLAFYSNSFLCFSCHRLLIKVKLLIIISH